MDVLFVNKYATVTGGADRYALDLAQLLRGRGHHIRFLAFGPSDDPSFPGRYLRPTVTRQTRGSTRGFNAARVAATMVWNRGVELGMTRLIEESRPDIIHMHKIFPQFSSAAAVVAHRYGIPIVQAAADFEFISASPEDDQGHKIDRIGATCPDRVVNTLSFALRNRFHTRYVRRWVVATAFMQQAYEHAGIRADLVPYFVGDAPPYASSKDRESVSAFADRKGVVFAGRLVPAKGINDVIEIARRNPDIPVTIAGTGVLEGHARAAAQEIDNLSVLGHLDARRLATLLASARLSLVPSQWAEPAGLAALEALSHGTPVVGYARGGLRDYIESNGGGIAVTGGDRDRFFEAVVHLYRDPRRWAQFAENARRGLQANHDPVRHVEVIEAIYREARSYS